MRTLFILNNTWKFRTDWRNMKSPMHNLILITSKAGFGKLDIHQKGIFYKIITTEDFSHKNISIIIQLEAKEDRKIDLKDARLATTDERLTHVAALVRQSLNIPGDDPSIVEKFRDKIVMKEYLKESKIRIPKFIKFSPELYQRDNYEYLKHIEHEIGYPMFIKPTDAGGSRGVAVIRNYRDFLSWTKANGNEKNYEVEELITGRFYHADCIVVDGKIIKTFVCEHNLPNDIALRDGKPITTISLPEFHKDSVKYNKYMAEVLEAMAPYPQNCVFDLDFFVTGKEECVFIEMACRSPGGMMAEIYNKICGGMNIEETYFRLQFGLPVTLKFEEKQHAAYFWVPRKAGLVDCLHTPLVDSEMQLTWHAKKGDLLEKAQGMSDVVASILVTNQDFTSLYKDYSFLCNFNFCTIRDPKKSFSYFSFFKEHPYLTASGLAAITAIGVGVTKWYTTVDPALSDLPIPKL